MNLNNLLKPKQIARYLAQLQAKGVSKATIKRKEAALKKFTDWAETELGLSAEWIKPSPKASLIQKLTRSFRARRVSLTLPGMSLTRYFGLIILLALTAGLGIFGYEQFVKRATKQLAYPSSLTPPSRILSFQGRLTDTGGTPITSATNFVFKLYDAETVGNNLWTSSTCSITPDSDGIFSARLGDTGGGAGECGGAIASSVFSENIAVWLEITVAAEVLDPRQPIATAAYALNAETLQGYPASPSATENTIPVINNSGDLVIASNAPTIESTSGTFAIKGQALTIQTPDTTNGDITINPDGTGVLDLTFEGAAAGGSAGGFVNATNANITSGALYYGEVASAASGYDFIQFKSGVTPAEKFAVSDAGDLTATGTITFSGLSTDGPMYTASGVLNSEQYLATSRGGLGANVTAAGAGEILYSTATTTYDSLAAGNSGDVLTSGGAGAPSWTDISSSGGPWTLSGTSLYPDAASSNVLIGSTTAGDAVHKLLVTGTNVGKALAVFNETGSNDIFVASASGTAKFIIDNSGNVGIGTTGPATTLHVEYPTATGNPTGIRIKNSGSGKSFVLSTGLASGDQNDFAIRDVVQGTYPFVIEQTTGNVGIGTTGPGAKLDVNGSTIIGTGTHDTAWPLRIMSSYAETDTTLRKVAFFGSYESQASAHGLEMTMLGGATPANRYISLGMVDRGSANTGNIVLQKDGGNIGIGTTGPSSKLEVAGNITLGDDNWIGIGSASERIIFDSDGNDIEIMGAMVGIGTTGPATELHIYSNDSGEESGIRVEQDGDGDASIRYQLTGVRSWSTGIDNSDSDKFKISVGISPSSASEVMTLDTSGNVGIGTTAPTSKLHVSGAVTGKALAIFDETGDQDIFTASASGTPKFTIARSGNLTATGTITGLTGITSSGTITFSGLSTDGPMYTASGVLNSEQYLDLARGGTDADLSGVATGGLIYKAATALAGTGALTGILKGNGASAPSAVTSTANYVTYWSDNNTIAGEQYLATSRGGLGANVTAAGAGEILYSTATTTYDSLAAGNSGDVLTSGGAGAPSWTDISSSGGPWTLSGTSLYPDASSSNVLIGSTTAGDAIHKLLVTGTNTGKALAVFNETGANDILVASASGTAKFVIDNSGNVGIGTTGPAEQLDITGNFQFVTTTSTAGQILQNGSRFIHSYGTNNLFMGANAGNFTLTGDENITFGANTGLALTTGYQNVMIGYLAGEDSTEARDNVFVGFNAGLNNTTGLGNTFVGSKAGTANTDGIYNMYLGFGAGEQATGGENVFVGVAAGQLTSGDFNTFVGSKAGLVNAAGHHNLFFGYSAGNDNLTGSNNVYIGYDTGGASTGGGGNVVVGAEAMKYSGGTRNAIVGYQAGYGASGNDYNDNTVFGWTAGHSLTTGVNNVLLGRSAGDSILTGESNIVIGSLAGEENTAGHLNVVIGERAVRYSTGSYNVVAGGYAGMGVTSSSNFEKSVVLGYKSGFALTTGDNNILIGWQAGDVLTTGASNIIIGYDIDPSAADASNELNIGNLIYGDLNSGLVGIGIAAPLALLHVGSAGTPGSIDGTDDLYVYDDLEVDGTIYGDGSGITGIAASPAGSDGQVQYNNGGAMGGASNLFYDDTNNKVGIGTTAPTSKLHVSGAVTGKALVIFDETGDQNILTASASGTPKFTIARDGSLTATGAITGLTGITSSGTITFSGLSTDGPMYTSSGVLNSEQYLNVSRGGIGVNASSASNGQLLIGNGSGFALNTLTAGTGITINNGSGSIEIVNNSLGSSQNIFKNFAVSGQNTVIADNNDDTLTLAEGSNITITTNDTTDTITITSSAGGGTPGGSDGQVQYNNGGAFGGASNLFYDDTNNKVGIGTTAPTSLLHVTGAIIGKALVIFDETGDQDIFTASASGTPKFVIDHSGNVGIGTTAPGAYKLNVNGNTNVTGTLTATTSVSTPLLSLSGTGTINGLDAMDATTETTLESYIDIAGDVAGTGLGSVQIQTGVVDANELASTAVTPGSYGSATQVGTFTVDADGRLTAAGNTTISGTSPAGSALTSAYIWVGNASNLAAAVDMTGDVDISNTGVTTVQDDSHNHVYSNIDETTSANWATRVSDEQGTGAWVFANTPTLITPVIGAATGTSLDLGGTTLLASRALTVDTGGVFNIALSAAAGDDFTVDTDKLVVKGDTGNVGIGTTAPSSALDVNGDIEGDRFLDRQDNTYYIDPANTTTSAILYGNVGIGETSPTNFKLEIDGSMGPDSNDDHDLGSDSLRWANLYLGAETLHIGTGASDEGEISYITASNVLQLDSDGVIALVDNVGIGTTAPTSKLHVTGAVTGKALAIFDETGDQDIFTASASGTPKFVITHDGNVGIGTTAPGTELDVAGNVNLNNAAYTAAGTLNRGYYVYKSGTTAYGMKLQYTGGEYGPMMFGPNQANRFLAFGKVGAALEDDDMVEYMRIDLDNGNVGIGTTAPSQKLDVVGSAEINGEILGITKLSFDQGTNFRIDTNASGLIFDGGDGNADFLIYDNLIYSDVITTGYSGTAKITTYDSGEDLQLTSNAGDVYVNDYLGVGTASPQTDLHVNGGSMLGTKSFGVSNGATARWSKFATLTLTSSYDHVHAEFIIQGRYTSSRLFVEVASGNAYNTVSVEQFYLRNNWGNGSATSSFKVGRKDTGSTTIWDIWVSTGTWGSVYFSTPKYSYTSDGSISSYYTNTYSGSDGATDPMTDPGGYDATISLSEEWYNNGNVGIGTTAPGAKLQVAGSGYELSATSGDLDTYSPQNVYSRKLNSDSYNWYWTEDSDNNKMKLEYDGDLVTRGTLTQSGSPDIAENIPAPEGTEAGDILSANPDWTGTAQVATRPYDSKLIGVVSTKPGILLNAELDDKLNEINTHNNKPLVLAGRVFTKVSDINGEIKIGDPITSSQIPGVGMKATKTGPIVARALQDFSTTGKYPCPSPSENYQCGKILAFITVGWHDPDAYLTNAGDLVINSLEQSPPDNESAYQVSKAGEAIEKIGAFAEIVAAKINSGLTEAREVITERLIARNIIVEEKIISPLIETGEIEAENIKTESIETNQIISDTIDTEQLAATQIQTDKISLDQEDLTINLTRNQGSGFGELLIQGKNDQIVAGIDAEGNADFDGTINAFQMRAESIIAQEIEAENITTNTLTAQEATFSSIYADNIVGKEGSFGEILADKIAAVRGELKELVMTNTVSGTSLLGQAEEDWPTDPASEEVIISQLIEDNQTNQEIIIAANLLVQGRITIDDIIVNQQLLAGNLLISENSITSLDQTLYLQPTGIGKVDLLAGILVVEDNGQVIINGNLTVNGVIAAEEFKGTKSVFGELLIKDINDEIVASIDASGSAQFAKVNIATDSAELVIASSQEESDEITAELTTNAAAGEGIIPANTDQVIIITDKITSQSLVYITPASDTQNRVLFVKEKITPTPTTNEPGSFTVAIGQPLTEDVKFNWWVIN